jgi:phosphoribosylformimino-5-aminoimidazole carboxamide ribonucleotide (ProFAR) isomerase
VQVYAAIDIQSGRVARSTGAADPVAWAERLAAGGARWLHVVDLDRAFGSGENDALIRRIARLAGVQVQMGGLLATHDDVSRAFALGAARAVVGTAALADAAALEAILTRHAARLLAASVDVRAGQVVRRGASSPLSLSPADLMGRAVAGGITVIVYRDLERDGTLAGPDLDGAARLRQPGVEVILAGGIATRSHLIAARDAGLAGAIVGRALIEGTITVEEALACSS